MLRMALRGRCERRRPPLGRVAGPAGATSFVARWGRVVAALAEETTVAGAPAVERAADAPAEARGVRRARATLLLLAPLLLLAVLSIAFPQTDPDYWWHARTGHYIVETGALPRADIFSYTAAGRPWVTHEWLTEVVFFLVARQAGYVGNVVLFGLLVAGALLAVYAMCRRRGAGAVGATLLTLWAFVIAMPQLNVRPQVVTFFCLAIFALLLTLYRQGDTRALWPLPPLMALWANLHGGYIIGLALLGLTIAGEVAARLFRREAAPLRPPLVATALTGLATLLTPHGLEALRYPFTYAGTGNASMRFIAEWQSPDFHQPIFLVFAASLLLLLVLGVGRRPLGPTETLWAVAFALLGLQSMRHIPLYAVVVTPLVGARLAAELAPYRGRWPRWEWRAHTAAGALAALLPLLFLGGALAQPGATSHLQLGREPGAAGYPAGAVAYLRAQHLRGNLYNDYAWGGYLIYELYPDRRVFVDGRADVYGDAFVTEARAVEKVRPDWRQILDRYDVQLALTGKDSALAGALRADPGWREVYADTTAELFTRVPSDGR